MNRGLGVASTVTDRPTRRPELACSSLRALLLGENGSHMYLNPLDSVHHLLIGSFLNYILTFSTLLIAMATFLSE